MWIIKRCTFINIYGLSFKGLMTLCMNRTLCAGLCLWSVLSYVGHVENDSHAGHKLAALEGYI